MNDELKERLKNKKLLFASWRATDSKDSPYQNMYLPLRDFFNRIIVFDTSQEYFRYGKKTMNASFLEILRKEKPDYIFLHLLYDEFELETLAAIKKILPESITLNLFSDDDSRYEDFTRYYLPYFDYPIVGVAKEDILKPHTQDGFTHIIRSHHTNCEKFRPLPVEKIYDVGLYGRANESRAVLLTHLLKNNINVHVWGEGWAKYPELQRVYHGFLDTNDLVKVINQTKINLCFTMGGYGKPNFKGRVLELGACKGFTLLEYYQGYLEFLKEEKDIAMFKDKNDLVKKIHYYLKHEKEREEIANALYTKVITNHDQHRMFEELFIRTEKERFKRSIPVFSSKAYMITGKDLTLPPFDLKKKVQDFEYVCFEGNATLISKYRDFVQMYSLEKSKKDISCCDYYVSSKRLGDYLLFKPKVAQYKFDKKTFDMFIRPSQIMLRTSYFLKNQDMIVKKVKDNTFDFINANNTVFVSIPLVSIPSIPSLDYSIMSKGAFQMKFLDTLYSLWYTKKIFFSFYPYSLLQESFLGKKFLRDSVRDSLTNKDRLRKVFNGV